ncbi:MAG: polyprenyl synthetase family protein [Patescibacteria group bacterium]
MIEKDTAPVDASKSETLSIQEFKERFDPILKTTLEQKISHLTKLTDDKEDASILEGLDYMKKLVLEDGKRIRPYMAYLMYSALGGKNTEQALRLFTSLELFHAFGFIHDDIIDKGSRRRGMDTLHIHIANKLQKGGQSTDYFHIGNSQSILLGDRLHGWSQEIINSNSHFDEEKIKKVRGIFAAMTDQVFVGQAIDVDMTTHPQVSTPRIDKKIRLKTASYTFIGPMLIGAALAGKDTENIERFCEEFGLQLGIAFQTQDDLFDIISPEKTLGKTTLSDIPGHQHTYLTQYVLENGTDDQKERLADLSNLPLTTESKAEIQQIFDESGAIQFGKKIIAKSMQAAQQLVATAPMETKEKNSLIRVINDLATRSH